MRIVRFSLRNATLIDLFTLLVMILAGVKVYDLRREAFPAAEFDFVIVSTPYPGASASEVERYVTDPLEREIESVAGIEELHSVSVEALSIITVKLDPDRSKDQKDQSKLDIQRAVDRTKDLPDDLPEEPLVNPFDADDFPILEVHLSGALDYGTLDRHAQALIEKLEQISDINHVDQRGEREKEYWVEVDPKKLERYELGLGHVIAAIAARNVSLPGGPLKAPSGEVLIRTVGELTSPTEMENVLLRFNDAGYVVRVRDVASVKASFEEPKRVYRANQRDAIALNVVMDRNRGDIIHMVDEIKKATDNYLLGVGEPELRVDYINDMSYFVKRRLGVLVNNGTWGLVFILAVMLLFLPKGISLVTVAGIPVSYAVTILVMVYAGMTINLISLFGLIIVLGLLGDDSVVIGENIWQHYERGATPAEAAIKGVSEVIKPVLATIFVTISAFAPLLMVEGVFGKFISEMPKVVIVTLLASLVEALFILPLHAYEMLQFGERWRGRKATATSSSATNNALAEKPREMPARAPLDKMVTAIVTRYGHFLRRALRLRYLVLTLFGGGLIGSLVFAKHHIPLILFPAQGIEVFFVRAEAPVGTPLSETAKRFERFEAEVAKLPALELKSQTTVIGVQQNDPNDPFTKRGTHVGQIQVFLTPPQDRQRSAEQVVEAMRAQLAPLTEAAGLSNLSFERMRPGPPVGKPVAIRVAGHDLEQLRAVAGLVATRLAGLNGVSDIDSSDAPGKDEMRIYVDEAAAARALLTVQQISTEILTAFEGGIASYAREAGERVAIRVRYRPEARERLATLENLKINNRAGVLIPLKTVVRFEQAKGTSQILHRDRKRVISVAAAIDEQVTTSLAVNQELLPYLAQLEAANPGVSLSAGGEFEDTNDSIRSLREAFIIAVALIFFILAAQFGSLTQPFVVMATIPLGIIGVIWTFYLHGMPLSFLAMFGVIGLTGVVINEANVLVTFTNNARQDGMSAIDATVHACQRRFRAVWMTTLGAVVGLVPLAYGIGGLDEFLQPAALALGYGQMFSSFLTLFFVPALYLIREDVEGLFARLSPFGNR